MLKVLFAGDFAPCRGFEAMARKKRKSLLDGIHDAAKASDLSFLNLETPLCRTGSPLQKSGPNIRAHPDCIGPVADAGFDVAGLANNHIMDFGPEGLYKTMEVCHKVGLKTCGAGQNLKEAQKSVFIEKKGTKVAIIAVAEHEFSIAKNEKPGAAPLGPIDNLIQLEQAKTWADLVFISIHGGNEHFPYPRPGLKKICKFFIDRGADAVICHHAHVPGAYEFYRDKPIVYSLGNLIFDHPNPPEGWNQGYAIRLEYDVQSKALQSHEIIPYTQSVDQGGIRKMQGCEKEAFMNMMESYRNTLSDEKKYALAWDNFCAGKRRTVLLKMFFPFQFRGLGKLARLLPIEQLALPKSTAWARKNHIDCESHRELLSTILEKKCR